jgi:hypothetical protein
VAHNVNQYEFTRAGRLMSGSKTVKVELFVSNAQWAAPAADAVPALEAVDALIDALTVARADDFILTVSEAGRHTAPGTAADRLIYRVALDCALRETITVALSR